MNNKTIATYWTSALTIMLMILASIGGYLTRNADVVLKLMGSLDLVVSMAGMVCVGIHARKHIFEK